MANPNTQDTPVPPPIPALLPTAGISLPAPMPLELGYAPQAKSRNRPVWVVAGGIITTVIALTGVYMLDARAETYVMGWYANYVIPIGAMLVGAVAASGYGIASWNLGVKIQRGLLWTVAGLLVVSFFAAEYIEFRMRGPLFHFVTIPVPGLPGATKRVPVGQAIGFWENFHLTAVNWRWKNDKVGNSATPSEPLGIWGYGIRLLGIAGFVAGGAAVPLAMMKRPYCELCERYMNTRVLGLLPASVPFKKFRKDPAAQAAHEVEQRQWLEHAGLRVNRMLALANIGDGVAMKEEATRDAGQKKQIDKLPRRMEVRLQHCRSCASGRLEAVLVSGQGKQTKRTTQSVTELPIDVVRVLAGQVADVKAN